MPEPLWQRVQARLKEVAATYVRDGGQWWGRPSGEKYLLTGMGKCSGCGKAIAVLNGTSGSGKARRGAHWYGCPWYANRGEAVCQNDHRARMDWLDAAVIESIRKQVLSPEAVRFAQEEAAALVERTLKEAPHKPRELEAEARKLKKELERFLRLIADGKAPESVLVEIRQREARLKQIEQELAALAAGPVVLSPQKIREMCGERIRRFEGLLIGDVPVARQALRKLLVGPLKVSPAEEGGRRTLRFEGMTTLGPLFDDGLLKAGRPHGEPPQNPPSNS